MRLEGAHHIDRSRLLRVSDAVVVKQMLRTIIIGADEVSVVGLETGFRESARFGLLRTLHDYPEGIQLERVLRAHAPDVVFLSVARLEEALRARAGIDSIVEGIPIVAFGGSSSQEILIELMKVGVREFVPLPVGTEVLYELADRLESMIHKNPHSFDTTDMTFTFLPAKPGVGTSTLALNVSLAMARRTKVFLADFDLNSGLIAFMLKLGAEYSLEDAAKKSNEIDEDLWPRLVTSIGELDVLPSGRTNPGFRIDPIQIHQLVSFARRQYGVICADLSGNMEKHSVELMQESKYIFVVTTSEIPPLHLARHRCQFLRSVDLGDRIRVLLNRYQKRNSVGISQIEELLEAKVFETLPNDYRSVHQSLVAGKPIDPATELGQACNRLAERALNKEHAEAPKAKGKRFLGHFNVLGRRMPLRT